MSTIVGIAREAVYSPGKVEQDRAILEAVAERLRRRHTVRVVEVDTAGAERRPDLAFAMCQGPAALALLRRWERTGVRVVNSAAAIESCQRSFMLRAFERHDVRHPASHLVATDSAPELPAWIEGGAWVKRGDVHAVESGDVVFARDGTDVRLSLREFHRRGIRSAVIQRHVSGSVVKFYAVRQGFLRCYESDPSASAAPARESAPRQGAADVATLAETGAAALGLEVYGGDMVRDGDGVLWLIDLNDWPSYGPCRSPAADAIGEYLDAQSKLS